jgi:hypothetical protein
MTPHDYRAAHAFLRAQDADEPLSFPTVVAIRDDAIVGLLSTQTGQGAVIAGPLVISMARPIFIAIRLIEAYERVLWEAGVRSYRFGIDATEGKAWADMVQRYGFEPYTEHAGALWFKRELQEAV